MKKILNLLLVFSVFLSFSSIANEDNRISIFFRDLTHSPHDISSYAYFSGLSKIGDFGEGGGAGTTRLKWYSTLRKNVRLELEKLDTVDIESLRGALFLITKHKLPKEVFNKLEVRPIKMFITGDYSYKSSDVYAVYTKSNFSRHHLRISDILAIELIDGGIIFPDEIKSVIVEFMP